MRKAVLLDRDGVINKDTGYISAVTDLDIYPEAGSAIKQLNEAGYLVIVVTNQSGIARGKFTEKDVADIHDTLKKELAKQGAVIDAIYYCPHLPDQEVCVDLRYNQDCQCRKPARKKGNL